MKLRRWWQNVQESIRPRRRMRVIDSDMLPSILPRRDLIVTREDQEDWSIGMYCPCGCGETIELLVVPEAQSSWSFSIDYRGRPSLSPSVWRRTGCRSHFWLREGRVIWCD